jgi:hypothetical protein
MMSQSAIDMDNPLTPGFDVGFDLRTGAGFIQADKCVQLAGGSILPVPTTTAARQTTRNVLSTKASLTAWPNPSGGVLNINGANTKGPGILSITNIIGQQLMEVPVPNGAWRTTLNIGRFGKGMYTVQVNNGKEIITQKVIVQ